MIDVNNKRERDAHTPTSTAPTSIAPPTRDLTRTTWYGVTTTPTMRLESQVLCAEKNCIVFDVP